MEEEKLIIKKNSDDYISANAQRYEILSNLYNINKDSYQEIIQQIKDHSDLFFKDHSSSILFFYFITQTAKYKFKDLELILDICVSFSSEIKRNNTTDTELITICYNFSNGLNYLFNKNFFTIESIVEKSITCDQIFITFLPEIEKYDSEYARLREKRLLSNPESNSNQKIIKYFQFVKSNPDHHISYRQLNYHPSPLHKSIRDDDVETFQSLLSKNNFSVNHKIEQSFYERLKMLIDDNLSLIQVAAFYGSINIFKFLWMQKNIEIDDNLLSYAYAGENIEIIHICEQKCPLTDAFLQPIFIHRTDLLDYYLDNFGDEIIEKYDVIRYHLKNYAIDEDNLYDKLNYKGLSIALFTVNFDVLKFCLPKIVYILRNIENTDKIFYNSSTRLLENCIFDFEMFKFLFSQRKENVKKSEVKNYFLALKECIYYSANDATKYILNELNEDKKHFSYAFINSIMCNNDVISNYILDLQLNEDRNDKDSLFNFMVDDININLLLHAMKHYNEDVVVKLLKLYKIIHESQDLLLFVASLNENLSSKMIMSLIDRISEFLPSGQLTEMANIFKDLGGLDISDQIFNKVSK